MKTSYRLRLFNMTVKLRAEIDWLHHVNGYNNPDVNYITMKLNDLIQRIGNKISRLDKE